MMDIVAVYIIHGYNTGSLDRYLLSKCVLSITLEDSP